MNSTPEVIQTRRTLRYAIAQILTLALFTAVLFYFATNAWLNYSIENIQAQQKKHLAQYVTLARSNIAPILERLQRGELTRQAALTEVRDTVRRMTYTDEYGPNYIFMSAYDGTMLVQPYEPHKEMTDMWGLQDVHGVYIIRELVRAARENPQGGYVSYLYFPPNSDQPEEKLSYVIGIPELDAYIGTGTYMGKFYARQESLVNQVRWLMAGSLLLMGGVALFAIRQLYLNNRQLVGEMEKRRKAQENVEMSEQNLQAVFNSIYDAIFIHDFQGRIQQVNQRMLEMYKVERSWALRSTIRDLSAPPDLQKLDLDEIWERVRQGQEQVFEWKCLRPQDGNLFDVEVALRPVSWYGRHMVLAVVRDVSERVRTQEELRTSELKYRRIVDTTNEGILMIDPEQVIIFANARMSEILGCPAGEVIERPLTDFLFKEEWSLLNAKLDERRKGVSDIYECRYRRKDGKPVWLLVSASPMIGEGGRFDGSFAMYTDITLQKEQQEVLRASEEKFRSVVEQMAEGLALTDEAGTVISWNKAQEEITGMRREDALERPLWEVQADLLPPEEQTEEICQSLKDVTLQALKDSSSSYFAPEGSMNIIASGEQRKTVLQTAFPVTTRAGHHAGLLLRDISDLRRSQEHVQQELLKLNALREIDAGIVSQESLEEILETVSEQAIRLLKADAVHFLMLDKDGKNMQVTASYGFKTDVSNYPHLLLPTCLPWQVVRSGKLVVSGEGEACLKCRCFRMEGFKAIYGLPIITRGQVRGVIELFTYKPLHIDQEWEDFFAILGGQAAVAIEKNNLFHDLQASNAELHKAYEETIAGWSRALELRDKETEGHSTRVMHLACELAKRLNYPQEEMPHFRRGVLLHDIGKMGIPDSILLKPGPLNDDEWQVMRMHPEFAYHLLADIPYLRPALDIPYGHHERWDGSGYPRGLKGEEIPLSARIFAVVDIWDALISDRPYRPGWSHEAVRRYLQQNAGILVDPGVTAAFLEMV